MSALYEACSSDGTLHAFFSDTALALQYFAYQVGIRSMQGATAIHGKFYVSSSRDANTQGLICTFTEGNGPVAHPRALPRGPEDFSYWRSKNQLWTLTEYPGDRAVLAVKASSF